MKEKCGCEYVPILGPEGQPVGGNLVFCQMHLATRIVFRVLQDAHEWLVKLGTGYEMDDADELDKLIAQIETVLTEKEADG